MKLHLTVKRMLRNRTYILITTGLFLALIIYLLATASVGSIDGYDIDISRAHQRELLDHWHVKQDEKKKVKVIDHEAKENGLGQVQFDEIKLMKIMRKGVQNKQRVAEKLGDVDHKYIYDTVNSIEKNEKIEPLIHIVDSDVKYETDEFIPCLNTSTNPQVTICIHNVSQDVFISKEIKMRRSWEPHILIQIQDILRGDPALGFIDIGANIGFYSLIIAKMGHKVVSVEPYMRNILVFNKAIRLESLQSMITLLHNGVSDKRWRCSLILDNLNQGGIRVADKEKACDSRCAPTVDTILMDDLLKVITFKRAIMKIDIEGGEHLAFRHPSELFRHIYIPYVFMEWVIIREYFVNVDTITKDKIIVQSMVTWFISHDYTPFCLGTGLQLDYTAWYGWGHDVLWKRSWN